MKVPFLYAIAQKKIEKHSLHILYHFLTADVRFAEIKMENGRSAGWGLVRFGNPDDAQRAICILPLKNCKSDYKSNKFNLCKNSCIEGLVVDEWISLTDY